ncbi:hemolysin-III related-domain-containing protein [Diplogelasinospora grovesii]|uniref:Hemolysin-III related-domain-containing protein n=1 Tax=Diplogelasinospora grovesii TaxID=303347 RepID=A0AAN6NCK2_9PEZI|nr:hemolysin-III related-domain-containing protein [Diplogelasinospora grovesii]
MPADSPPGAPGAASLRQRRPSTAADAIAHAAKQVETAVEHTVESVEKALLVLWDELPTWRRDNAYILSGYRSTSNSYYRSFTSLGYIHNESVNIWSHLLGAVAFTFTAFYLYSIITPRYESASESDLLVFACFFAGAFLCLGMSATYHTLSNHSPEVARWGNKLDYTGIVFLIVGSYVPALYYGFYCLSTLLTIYLFMICLLGVGCLTVSWFEHFRTPAWRPYRALMFVGLGLSGVVPVLHGLTIYGYGTLNDRMGLSWVILQGGLYIFGAFLYAARWPERQFPGTFDIWGSSHQIFHIFVLLAAASHLYGMARAFDFHHSVFGGMCS